jgi:AraC-like DNA-binding protein
LAAVGLYIWREPLRRQEFTPDEPQITLGETGSSETFADELPDDVVIVSPASGTASVSRIRYSQAAASVTPNSTYMYLYTDDPKPVSESAVKQKIKEFMRDHFREELSAAEIAAAAGFSQNYFSQKFRQATGTGIHEYLTYVRLQQAALELLETRDSVTEIALRCGFSRGNYFKDVFRKRYGVSPRAYRSGAAAFTEQEGR